MGSVVYGEGFDLGPVIGDRSGFDESLKDVRLCEIKAPIHYCVRCPSAKSCSNVTL